MALTAPPAAGAKLRASVLSALILERTPLIATKAADGTPVNNSTTLVADSELFLAVEANASYTFDGYLLSNSGTTPDIKIGATGPTGATMRWSLIGPPTTVTSAAASDVDFGLATTISITHSRAGVAGNLALLPYGRLLIGANAGTFTITMAQATATASDTKLLADSWIRLTRFS